MSHAMHIVVDRPIFLYTIPCFIEPLCRSLCFIHLSIRFVDLALSTVCAHLYVFGRWLSSTGGQPARASHMSDLAV